MRKLTAIAILSLLGCPASAGVAIRVVDYPHEVLRYSPLLVTAEIRNDGKEAILVPATNFTANRFLIETGDAPDRLTELRPYETSGGGSVVWLQPGAKWLFQEDIGPWVNKTGPVFIRVGIQSGGECQYYANGSEKFPLRVIEKRPGVETYRCWSGQTKSEVIQIDVAEPEGPTDLAALEFVRSKEFPGTGDLDNKFNYRLRSGFGALLDRFPASHYTYVGGFYACEHSAECLQKLLDAQPGNPLTPYTRLQQAMAALQAGHAKELTSTAINDLHLPPGLSNYLVQEKDRVDAKPPMSRSISAAKDTPGSR